MDLDSIGRMMSLAKKTTERLEFHQQGRCWGCSGLGCICARCPTNPSKPLSLVANPIAKKILQPRKRRGLGLKSLLWYPDTSMATARVRLQPSQKKECNQMNDQTLLSIQATMDPGMHLTLNAQINSLLVITLMDIRATGVSMHHTFAQACHAKIQSKTIPREVRVIDGRTISFELITQEATIELCVGDHREIVTVDLTNTGHYPCVLETPWFVCHNLTIQWAKKENSSIHHIVMKISWD